MKRLRLGYVGCGFMAQKVHLPNFAAIDGCELAAIAELRPEVRHKVAVRMGIEREYGDHHALLRDESLDAFAVSADYSSQSKIAEDLLSAGKPVFMEKPMATSVKRSDEILAAEAAHGGRLMVGFMKRFDEGNIVARNYVRKFRQSGEAGRITFVRNHGFCGDWLGGLDTPFDESSEQHPPSAPVVPDWLPENRHTGYIGYLQQYTHNLNLLRWFLDAGSDAQVLHVDLDDDGMTGIAVLTIAGVRVVLESGSISHYRWDEHTQVYFQHGWVKADAPPLLLRNVPAEVEVYRGGTVQEFVRPVPSPAWTWSYRREAEHFINASLTGVPFESPASDCAVDVRLYEDIYRMWLRSRGEVK